MKKLILNKINDLVSDFLYYDRKEDEDLGIGSIDIAIDNKEITIEEIVKRFEKELRAGI